jgi:two-component system sensor histidine kinase SenX3
MSFAEALGDGFSRSLAYTSGGVESGAVEPVGASQPSLALMPGDHRHSAPRPGSARREHQRPGAGTAWAEPPQPPDTVAAVLQSALGALAVGVVACDRDGHELYRNAAAGVDGHTNPGGILADRAVAQLLQRALAGQPAERALELFSPTRRTLAIRAFPVPSAGGLLGAVAVVEDASERRRLDAMRRDFVANVSHELKTPVGALSLLAETLEGEDDPEQVNRLVARVGTEAERLGRIIDDLLDLSRIEAAEPPPSDRIPVGAVVADAVEPLRAVAASQGIGLEVDEPAGETVVAGDRRDLTSAVANLVDNAVKYSEAGSLVRVRVRSGAGAVRIEVVDQGIGIPARDRERIFERFYRVDRARSRLTGGTGLGLSIVRHVAANHGGEVTVESQEGEGSTFTLVLPAGGPEPRGGADG